MASSSSECSDDESNRSDSVSRRIKSTPWATKESLNIGPVGNSFKNDGSFLEMFKKMQEQNSQNVINQNSKAGSSDDDKVTNSPCASTIKSSSYVDPKSNANPPSDERINKNVNTFVGKRRSARVLPTGLVKKQRKDGDDSSKKPGKESARNDPWLKYMDEVRKYKQQSCSEEESSRRPLVK